MYTQFDKAIVALIMSGVQVANVFGYNFGMDQTTVGTIVAVLTPILVHLIPNLPKDKS
jgi:hypothetical protein